VSSLPAAAPRSTGTLWERPLVFHWLARHVEEEELRRVFNLGIGWCAVGRESRAR
jgi:phosphoribosylaminoimidazole (AIR) synthetase